MPIYTYECKCGYYEEHVVAYDNRDTAKYLCPKCEKRLSRQGVELFGVGQPAYQMQALMSDGSHVKGHFGKESKRLRKKK